MTAAIHRREQHNHGDGGCKCSSEQGTDWFTGKKNCGCHQEVVAKEGEVGASAFTAMESSFPPIITSDWWDTVDSVYEEMMRAGKKR